jgi:phage-related tail fiber protein
MENDRLKRRLGLGLGLGLRLQILVDNGRLRRRLGLGLEIRVNKFMTHHLTLTVITTLTLTISLGSALNGSDDVKWKEMYQALIAHGKDKNGTYNVNKTFKLVDSESKETLDLGLWLHKQRTNKEKGTLTRDKEALLQALVDEGSLVWNPIKVVRKKDDDKWNLNFETFVRFMCQYGHGNVQHYTEYPQLDGTPCNLGYWINAQRRNKRQGSLSVERERKFQEYADSGAFKWSVNFCAT